MADTLFFEIESEPRFARLKFFIDALAKAKVEDEWHDDAYWESFLDRESRASFWWPTDTELAEWSERWFSTPVKERFEREDLKTPWTFGSLVDAARNGDYRLLGCSRLGGGGGAISFEPLGWPYGGTGWMRVAVEAFGGFVTVDPSG